MKRKEQNQQPNENSNQSQRQNELEKEINLLNKSGLQSPPTMEKSGSSKLTKYSTKTEKR